MKYLRYVGIIAFCTQSVFGDLTDKANVTHIGNQRQLFLDDFLIESFDGATLKPHHPTPREIAIVYDRPWEGNTSAYTTILKIGETFRMYYRGSHFTAFGRLGTEREPHAEFTCIAESKDGIHWQRPNVGLVDYEGSTNNNIIPIPTRWTHCFTPFIDPCATCATDERFKAVAYDHGSVGLYAFRSSDGISWSMMGDKPIITEGRFDSQNLAFYDTARKRYVAYIRNSRDGVRDIMVSFSKDFRVWTQPQFLSYNSGAKLEDLYTNAIQQYDRAPQYMLGFPMRFHDLRLASGNLFTGLGDGLFMFSRDGVHFTRWPDAFKRPGRHREAWFNRCNYAAWGLIETASDLATSSIDLSIFYSEGFMEGAAVSLRRHTIRPDGFMSIWASAHGGRILTKPFVFDIETPSEKSTVAIPQLLKPMIITNCSSTVRHHGGKALLFPEPGCLEIPDTKSLGGSATFAVNIDKVTRGKELRLFSAYDKGKAHDRNLFCFHLYLAPLVKDQEHSLLRCWYSPVGKVEIKGKTFEQFMTSSSSHHVAATYQQGKLRLYIDGQCVAVNNSGKSLPLEFSLGNLRLGNDYPPNGIFDSPFLGYMNEILILKRALSDQEIELLSKKGAVATINVSKEPGILYTMEQDHAQYLHDALAADGEQNAYVANDMPMQGDAALFLNCDTAALGFIRVEIRNANNKVISGFSLDECDPIYDDNLERKVSWRRKTDLAHLAGIPLRLYIELQDADIYSLRFGQ